MSKVCIVISTYNSGITNHLYNSAKKKLVKSKINKIHTVKVPGSFEIPVAISRLSEKYDGFIAIGCIIKGETENFNLISKSITEAIMLLSTVEKKPIGNAILTCFNREQASQRLNKGEEAADAVLKALSIQ